MLWWPELCGRGAISLANNVPAIVTRHDEKLDAQHAHVPQRFGDAMGRSAKASACMGSAHIGRRHLRHRQDAVAMQVLLHRQVHFRTRGITRHHDADFMSKRAALFQHTRHSPSLSPRSSQSGRSLDTTTCPCRHSPGGAVLRMPGSSASFTAAKLRGRSITAYGAQGTPACDELLLFQRAVLAHGHRCRHWVPHGGARPSVISALAGTFSNSVVMAELRCSSCARPASSR